MPYTYGSSSGLIVQLKTQLEKNPQYLKLCKDDHRFAALMAQCYSTDDLLRLLINIDDFHSDEVDNTLSFIETEICWALYSYNLVTGDLLRDIINLKLPVADFLKEATKLTIREKIDLFNADFAYFDRLTAYSLNFNSNIAIPNQEIEQLNKNLVAAMNSYIFKGFFKIKKEHNKFWNTLIDEAREINDENKLINFLIKLMEINHFQLSSPKIIKNTKAVIKLILEQFSNWLGSYNLQNLFNCLNKKEGMALTYAIEFLGKLKMVKLRTNSYSKILQAATPNAGTPIAADPINETDAIAPKVENISEDARSTDTVDNDIPELNTSLTIPASK